MRPHNHFEAASNWYISLFLIGLLLFSPLAQAQSANIDPLVRTLQTRRGALVYENAKDPAGNVINRTSNAKQYRYVYDEENRLTEVWENNAKKIEMAYGYAGNRLRKEVLLGGGRSIRTTYLGSVQIHESVVNGTVTERSVTTHIAGSTGKLLTSTRGTLGNNQPIPLRGPAAGDHYFLQDHLGSQARELDAAGTVVSVSTYEPYGQLFIQGQNGSVGRQQNHGYTGQELDEHGGLMYYGARFYDPGAGRFMSADSIIPDPKKSHGWNPFMYVSGDPMKFNDPSGHAEALAFVKGFFERGLRYAAADPPMIEGMPDYLVSPLNYVAPPETALDLSGEGSINPMAHAMASLDAMLESSGAEAGAHAYDAFAHLGQTVTLALGFAKAGAASMPRKMGSEGVISPVVKYLSPQGKARDVVVVKTKYGPQGFYKSSGTNSGRPGEWFPFDGVMETGAVQSNGTPKIWVRKSRFCTGKGRQGPNFGERVGNYGDVSKMLGEQLEGVGPQRTLNYKGINKFLEEHGAYQDPGLDTAQSVPVRK
ncbi:MAG: RHS repeat-associated core domain-containing protein [Deltaproteobacteria bacterium]|nr:RHS repeat-associated core domain-containing protein [Deltaproteobacteria bacterium]